MIASNETAKASGETRRIKLTVLRQERPGEPKRRESFDVNVSNVGGSDNVISCLQKIAANPTTTDGKQTTPIAYESGCLEEVCGSCTMVINGKVRQACSCLIDDYAPNEGDELVLEPMSKFPVIRDLWVDRRRLFNDLKRVKAWVPIDGTYHLGAGPEEAPDDQQTRYRLSTCMSCGCCLEACPQYNYEDLDEQGKAPEGSFVGAAVISQARYFNEHETGSNLKKVRLDELSKPGGVSDCGNAQNCVEVCPKEIPLTESIGSVGRQVTVHAIKKFFSGS